MDMKKTTVSMSMRDFLDIYHLADEYEQVKEMLSKCFTFEKKEVIFEDLTELKAYIQKQFGK
jgi:hypothetical protein